MKPVISIIFSKDRAMQLRATLESFYTYFLDADEFVDLYVLYKASNEVYKKQYLQLMQEFPMLIFVEENHLVEDIRHLLSNHSYVFFQVDDNITINPCFIRDALTALERSDILGFSYRLGKNTNYCYMLRSYQRIPHFLSWNNILIYDWTQQEFDFGYPLEVSSSIYRVSDVMPYMTDANVPCLVMVEGTLNKNRNDFLTKRPYLCCYPDSRMFSLPLNNTSGYPDNRAGELEHYSEGDLALLFDLGKRINVSELYGIQTNSCHQEFPVNFVDIKDKMS